MTKRVLGARQLEAAFVCVLSFSLPIAAAEKPAESTAATSAGTSQAGSEIDQLKRMLADQQRQIDELRRLLLAQKAPEQKRGADAAPVEATATPIQQNTVEIASTSSAVAVPVASNRASAAYALAVPSPEPQASPAKPQVAGPTDGLQKSIDAINANLRGFRFTGDMRFRFDSLTRAANTAFAPSDNRSTPMQRDRERYRVRVNIDKDLFYSDKSDRSLAHFHFQLATDPYNNPITMDTDFAGIATRAPFSIAEAYIDFTPLRGLSFRAGRTTELFADNRQFVYDDDIRFNGFHETYRWTGKKNGLFVEAKAAQYILTDPNIQVVPAGSPFISAGYKQGQRVPSANLLDQGITVGSNLGKKWSHNEIFNWFVVRQPNQIQFASTANGAPLFQNNPILGATLTSALGGTGNATTSAGGAIYYASDFHVSRGGFNLNYSGSQWMGHNFPFALFLQGTHNSGAKFDQNGYMLGASLGQAARLGDVQLQYQYFYKPANAFISQFSDDDVGTGSGVNVKTNQIRVNFGLTRFLAWENRLYIQHGISISNPAINYFVPLQEGYHTQFRVHSQLLFTF